MTLRTLGWKGEVRCDDRRVSHPRGLDRMGDWGYREVPWKLLRVSRPIGTTEINRSLSGIKTRCIFSFSLLGPGVIAARHKIEPYAQCGNMELSYRGLR